MKLEGLQDKSIHDKTKHANITKTTIDNVKNL